MDRRAGRLRVLGLLLLLMLPAAAWAGAHVRPCLATASPMGEGVGSPNWLVGFHRMPWGLQQGGTYLGAPVEHVDDELRWISVTAGWAGFPAAACMDPRVRYVEPNRPVGLAGNA